MTPRSVVRAAAGRPCLGFFALPVLYLVSLSFKTKDDVLSGAFLPTRITFDNCRRPSSRRRSPPSPPIRFLVAILAGLLTLVITLPAAYACCCGCGSAGRGCRPDPVEFHGSAHRRYHPLFYLLKAIGLLNTAAGLVLVYGTANVPVAFWLLTPFLRRVPIEVEQSRPARRGGAAAPLVFIVLPMIAPGLAATA